jgi:hypothetical protein
LDNSDAVAAQCGAMIDKTQAITRKSTVIAPMSRIQERFRFIHRARQCLLRALDGSSGEASANNAA